MGRYLIRRLVWGVFTLWGLASVVFLLLRLFPGGPFDDDLAVFPQVKLALEKAYHLSGSPVDQYFDFLNSCLHGDLGVSVFYPGETVAHLITRGFATTAAMNLSAVLMLILISLCMALVVHLYPRSAPAIRQLEKIGIALPNLFLAPLLIWLLCFETSVFPLRANGTIYSLILPIFLLAFRPACSLARILDLKIAENLRQDFARTHLAQGVSDFRLVWRWCLRSCLPTFLQQLPILGASLLSGSLLIDMLFSIQGLGSYFTGSLLNRDWGLSLGLALFFGVMLVVLQIVSDALMMILDPRVRVA